MAVAKEQPESSQTKMDVVKAREHYSVQYSTMNGTL
jgi:hypothetical protein